MRNDFNKILKITNHYLILATPLIIYSILTTVYVTFTMRGRVINIILSLMLYFIMNLVFLSGWFTMVKKAVDEPLREDANSLIKEFVSGVGEYILPVFGASFNVTVLNIIFMIIALFIGAKFIGDIGVTQNALMHANQSLEATKAFVNSLSHQQAVKILLWYLTITTSFLVCNFIIFFQFPAIYFKTKNPFKALLISLKDIFNKKIFNTIAIYMLIIAFYLLINIIFAFTGHNLFFNFVATLLNFYFIVLATVSVFYYYENNFHKNYLGQNLDETIS